MPDQGAYELPRQGWASAHMMSLRIAGFWLPGEGALHSQVVKAAMCLSDGHLALKCVRRCQAHLARHTSRCLAPERLNDSPTSAGARYCLGG